MVLQKAETAAPEILRSRGICSRAAHCRQAIVVRDVKWSLLRFSDTPDTYKVAALTQEEEEEEEGEEGRPGTPCTRLALARIKLLLWQCHGLQRWGAVGFPTAWNCTQRHTHFLHNSSKANLPSSN